MFGLSSQLIVFGLISEVNNNRAAVASFIVRLMLAMVKVKYTARKSQMASQQMRDAHPCRFPGCTRAFSHRQGMS